MKRKVASRACRGNTYSEASDHSGLAGNIGPPDGLSFHGLMSNAGSSVQSNSYKYKRQ